MVDPRSKLVEFDYRAHTRRYRKSQLKTKAKEGELGLGQEAGSASSFFSPAPAISEAISTFSSAGTHVEYSREFRLYYLITKDQK